MDSSYPCGKKIFVYQEKSVACSCESFKYNMLLCVHQVRTLECMTCLTIEGDFLTRVSFLHSTGN